MMYYYNLSLCQCAVRSLNKNPEQIVIIGVKFIGKYMSPQYMHLVILQ